MTSKAPSSYYRISPKMTKSIKVSVIPRCDLCSSEEIDKPAYAYARLPYGWAFICLKHFIYHGCRLGTGWGQRLVLDTKTRQ
jgi:hypothetical protein